MTQFVIHSPPLGGLITHENIDVGQLVYLEDDNEVYDDEDAFEQRLEELTPDHVDLPDAIGDR